MLPDTIPLSVRNEQKAWKAVETKWLKEKFPWMAIVDKKESILEALATFNSDLR